MNVNIDKCSEEELRSSPVYLGETQSLPRMGFWVWQCYKGHIVEEMAKGTKIWKRPQSLLLLGVLQMLPLSIFSIWKGFFYFYRWGDRGSDWLRCLRASMQWPGDFRQVCWFQNLFYSNVNFKIWAYLQILLTFKNNKNDTLETCLPLPLPMHSSRI